MQETEDMQVRSLGQEDSLEEGMENPMDRGDWWGTVHRFAESDMIEAT